MASVVVDGVLWRWVVQRLWERRYAARLAALLASASSRRVAPLPQTPAPTECRGGRLCIACAEVVGAPLCGATCGVAGECVVAARSTAPTESRSHGVSWRSVVHRVHRGCGSAAVRLDLRCRWRAGSSRRKAPLPQSPAPKKLGSHKATLPQSSAAVHSKLGAAATVGLFIQLRSSSE